MNFKKTCKSIVSFVLGTGMMFSGSAFNNKSNAIFPEEFYAANQERYKDNKQIIYILDFLRHIACDKDLLYGSSTDYIISSADEKTAEVNHDAATLLTQDRALKRWHTINDKSEACTFLAKTFPYLLKVAVEDKVDGNHLNLSEEILNNLETVINSFELTRVNVSETMLESYRKTFGPVIEICEFYMKSQQKYKGNKFTEHILDITRKSSSFRVLLRNRLEPEELDRNRRWLKSKVDDVRLIANLVADGKLQVDPWSELLSQKSKIKDLVSAFFYKACDYLLYNVANPPEEPGFAELAEKVIDALDKVITAFDLPWDYVRVTLQWSCHTIFNYTGGTPIYDIITNKYLEEIYNEFQKDL